MPLHRLINRLNPRTPRGIIWSTAGWVEAEKQRRWGIGRSPQPPAWTKVLAPETECADDPAMPAPAGGYYERVRWGVTPKATLTYIAGARILGAEGAVLSPDNRVFAEHTFPPGDDWRTHSCFRRRRMPPLKPLRGWYATIALPSSEFYFHWMLESLPRMKLLQGCEHLLDEVIVSAKLKPFHISALAMLGFPRAKLIELDPGSHYEVRHLFVPATNLVGTPPKWIGGWYRDKFVKPDHSERRRRIFVSREDASVRRLENEAEVFARLERLGFEKVLLTPMSFEEQAALFDQAEIVAGAHGGGFSNIVFCRPGTRLVEIMPPDWMPPCYYALARAVGLSYRSVIGQGGGRMSGGQLLHFSADPESIEKAVLQ